MSIQQKMAYGDANTVYEQDLINVHHYHKTVTKLREFFTARGFLETPSQSRLSILAACEDPKTVQTYQFIDKIWPLPQTGQMWLEYELLTNPKEKGFFCISTSYREEKNPIAGRHKLIFPMFEFETHGDLETLKQLEKDLVNFLGLNPSGQEIPEITYEDAMKKYNTKELTAADEQTMKKDFGTTVLLTDFPLHTSPFWNMALYPDGVRAKKVDVIIDGNETIGSAQRSSNKEEMRHMFYNISDGGYAKLLFDQFGKERVEKELEDFLKLDFIPRVGGGIGVTRLISALVNNGIIA